jgi:hypothetical protein
MSAILERIVVYSFVGRFTFHQWTTELDEESAVAEGCPSVESLAAYIDHALSPLKRAAVEAHLSFCALCRTTVALTVKSQTAVPDPASPGRANS